MKIPLTSIAVGAFLVAIVAGQTPPSRPALSVGYISAQRVFAESADGKTQGARLQALQQQRASELRARQQTLENVRRQVAQATDSAARVQLQQQELQQRTDLERATAQAQQELQTLQRQVQADFQTLVKGVLDELTKGQGLQLVLNADQAVLWSAPGMDLTSAVIERLNSKTAAAPAKPKP
jgi:Skp family chaperone for outer membrane proteins